MQTYYLTRPMRRLASSAMISDPPKLINAVDSLLVAAGFAPLPNEIDLNELADAIENAIAAAPADDADAPEPIPADDMLDPTMMSRNTPVCPKCLDKRGERVALGRVQRGSGYFMSCPVCKHEVAPAAGTGKQTAAARHFASEPFRRTASRKPGKTTDAEIRRQLQARGIKPSW